MNNNSGKSILIVRILATVCGCLLVIWIGWAIYESAAHPMVPPFGAPINGIVASQQSTPGGGNFSPPQCLGFGGFSADVENNTLATQYDRARYLSNVPGLVLFQVEYFCESVATGTVEQKYTFYDNGGHTMYELDNTALDGGNGSAILQHETFPGDGCGGSLQWNISSAQAITQFMNDGGSEVVADAMASGTPTAFDAKLFCMPPGIPEWTISLSTVMPNGFSKFLRLETYNAVNGAVVPN